MQQEAQTMQMHQKMMADMKAMDEKLNALVPKMNAATGEAKVNATADVVRAVVQQCASMRRVGDRQWRRRLLRNLIDAPASLPIDSVPLPRAH